jgi:CMP-N,N'-diacetyllegionaminic acid synthase
MKPKVLAVISARGGSKEVPGKNLKPLGGKPLIWYMLKKALASKLIDRVICSTDDKAIADAAKEAGAEVPFMRPKDLAEDHVPLLTVTQHVMQQMDKEGFKADIVVQLAPTCPFIRKERIDESIEMVMRQDCECAVSLKLIEHEHPYRARRVTSDGSFENFIKDIKVESFHSRQDLPTLYCTSGGIYTRKRHLLDNFNGKDFAMGQKRKGILLDETEAVNIDRLIDFRFAEFLISSGVIHNYV